MRHTPSVAFLLLLSLSLAGCSGTDVPAKPADREGVNALKDASKETPVAKPVEKPAMKIITTASGLQYEDLVVGNGPAAKAGDNLEMHYTGWLMDGTKFDSSLDRGQVFPFQLGARRVIKGWDEGVAGMKAGGKRRLIIPPTLGYGPQGYPPEIPPNATLTFEVQLVRIR